MRRSHLRKRYAPHVTWSAIGAVSVVIAYFGIPALIPTMYTASGTPPQENEMVEKGPPPMLHVATPNPMRGIYMSQCVAGTASFRENLVELVRTTDLNTLVVDIRDYTGKISFPTDNPLLKDFVSENCGAKDMKEFIETLHKENIYVIGRITTFQNPYYTSLHPEEAVQKVGGGVWKDYKGLSFVDIGAKPYWDTVVELGKVAHDEIGFDELNFDYIRFPSDGPMKEADYSWSKGKSKPEALEEFYKYLTDNLRGTGAVLSVDLFGMVATNEDDLNIGQVLERTLPYFDYVYPMVYPSHYPSGFRGYKNVNEHPYDIVKFAMDSALARAVATTTLVAAFIHTPITRIEMVPATEIAATTTVEVPTGLYSKPSYPPSKIRPWLQSFDYPVPYTPQMVEAQIQATTDAGLDSWLFWDAANKYTSLRKVLTTPVVSNVD